MTDLSPGDFIYKSNEELFLVVAEERDNSYLFAVHGWWDIDKERVEEYVRDNNSKFHTQDEAEEIIKITGDENTQSQLNKLKQLFAVYEKGNVSTDSIDTLTLEDK